MNMAKVIACRFISPTVKWFRVRVVEHSQSTFKPGQWADVYIPGTDLIGGYSMCSSPNDLLVHQTFDLAVKKSDHPPTLWMTNSCEVGSEFSYSFGGDVYLEDDCSAEIDLMFIAGGVGINPLYSMLLTAQENLSAYKSIKLLYSATSVNELQFKDELDKRSEQNSNIQVSYFVTKESESARLREIATTSSIQAGRITENDLNRYISDCDDPNRIKVYICGPNAMMSSMEQMLLKSGLSQKQIRYEVWW